MASSSDLATGSIRHQYATVPNDDIINSSNERILLLHSVHQQSKFEKLWIFGLGSILIVGLCVGIYLLCAEGKDLPAEEVDIISKLSWSDLITTVDIPKLTLPMQRILLIQTNSSGCHYKHECIRELQALQKNHIEVLMEPDILYNFILGGDGRVYEGRGWKYQSPYKDANEEILTIAFLGTYDRKSPTEKQIKELEAFFDYAIMDDDLLPCFSILVRDRSGRYILDIALQLQKRIDESNFC